MTDSHAVPLSGSPPGQTTHDVGAEDEALITAYQDAVMQWGSCSPDRYEADLPKLHDAVEDIVRRLFHRFSALNWEATRLRSALENWGRHHGWCARQEAPSNECNCGFFAAMSAPKPAIPKWARELDDAMYRGSNGENPPPNTEPSP